MAVALAATSLALAAVGTGVSVYSTIQQGKAAEEQAKFQEKLANNAAITARDQAKFEERQITRRNKQVLGKQRAAAAKSGVAIDGSIQDVIEDSTVQGEFDRLAALYSGELRARSAEGSAEAASFAAENIRRNTLLTTAGTAIFGASAIAGAGAKLPSFSKPAASPKSQSITLDGFMGPTTFFKGK